MCDCLEYRCNINKWKPSVYQKYLFTELFLLLQTFLSTPFQLFHTYLLIVCHLFHQTVNHPYALL